MSTDEPPPPPPSAPFVGLPPLFAALYARANRCLADLTPAQLTDLRLVVGWLLDGAPEELADGEFGAPQVSFAELSRDSPTMRLLACVRQLKPEEVFSDFPHVTWQRLLALVAIDELVPLVQRSARIRSGDTEESFWGRTFGGARRDTRELLENALAIAEPVFALEFIEATRSEERAQRSARARRGGLVRHARGRRIKEAFLAFANQQRAKGSKKKAEALVGDFLLTLTNVEDKDFASREPFQNTLVRHLYRERPRRSRRS